MDDKRAKDGSKIREKDVRGLKYFDQLSPFCSRQRRSLYPSRELIVSLAVQKSACLTLAVTAPLLKEKGNLGFSTLVAD